MSASEHAVNFEAVKISLTQDKNGFVLKLSIHPNDVPEQILRDWVGARYIVAMVRTNDDGSVVENPDVVKAKRSVTMAAMLCTNQQFQVWMVGHGYSDDIGDDHAAAGLRRVLNIKSRADLKTDHRAREKFFKLVDMFEEETRQ